MPHYITFFQLVQQLTGIRAFFSQQLVQADFSRLAVHPVGKVLYIVKNGAKQQFIRLCGINVHVLFQLIQQINNPP
ncbi:MAG: hypothetical protein IBX50_12770 [Marinospirillum sp.]|nr:hypothetical protein [Marinospirillum sp.]